MPMCETDRQPEPPQRGERKHRTGKGPLPSPWGNTCLLPAMPGSGLAGQGWPDGGQRQTGSRQNAVGQSVAARWKSGLPPR